MCQATCNSDVWSTVVPGHQRKVAMCQEKCSLKESEGAKEERVGESEHLTMFTASSPDAICQWSAACCSVDCSTGHTAPMSPSSSMVEEECARKVREKVLLLVLGSSAHSRVEPAGGGGSVLLLSVQPANCQPYTVESTD